MDKRLLYAALVVLLFGFILGARACGGGSNDPETVATDQTEVTVDQSSCLFNCNADVLVAEEGAEVEVYHNEQSTTFGSNTAQQGEALNNQETTFGGNTASLGAEGSSINLQEGQDLHNEQESSADKGDPPLFGTVPGWLWFGFVIFVMIIIYVVFIRPRQLASQLDQNHGPPPYI
ncbi:hypothetical protein KC909_00775 [Candidatus Dojkabacteria bacterium]|uniref:Uncharacterized protein n=1 Tax=Candidatus Dojkabacteria bacterium TaxID=2099670 RepID=A0A955RIY8_9BACT|nr:hypothetical protein [Candidatus Dojkabacteria bacterium]